jgi:hypothetical protein
MSDLSWKDQLLLREMEHFETYDRSLAGPRAPLPQDDQAAEVAYWRRATTTALIDRDGAIADAARNRRAFKRASAVAGLMAILAIAGWVR